MGVWGPGPFDNEAAMDFVQDISEMPNPEAAGELQSVMTDVVENDVFVDKTEMSAALAGASLVATQIDPSLPLPGSVQELLAGRTFEVENLRDLAKRVFLRSDDPDNNDWYDQRCGDSEGFANVEAKNGPYRRVLQD